MIKVTNDNIYDIINERLVNDSTADLLDIDVSEVTNMNHLFFYKIFNGDISQWDTSCVTNMKWMFSDCIFNGDISRWDVSKCIDMSCMFYENKRFNQDISHWIIDKNCNYDSIFEGSVYDKALPKGMDPRRAFGKDYDKLFKQKMEKTIQAL